MIIIYCIMQGVQVYVEVKDEDYFKFDDLADLVLVDFKETLRKAVRKNYTGIYNLVTMDLTITVFCQENFVGPHCSKCLLGFTGPDCDRKDHCLEVDCSGNGKCVNNFDILAESRYTCSCNSGYKGVMCEDIDCAANNCSGHGKCWAGASNDSSPSCNCSAGFTGRVCEIELDLCSSNPCGENGQCVDGVGNFTCECEPGFSGEVCDEGINHTHAPI